MSRMNAEQKCLNAEKRIALDRKVFVNRQALRSLSDETLRLVIGGDSPGGDSVDRLAANHNGKLVKVSAKADTRMR